MELKQAAEGAANLAALAFEKFERHPRRIAKALAALAMLNIAVLGSKVQTEDARTRPEAISCIEPICEPFNGRPTEALQKDQGFAIDHKSGPKTPPKIEGFNGLNEEVKGRINKVHLTQAGYLKFLSSIDRSNMAYAHKFKAFRTGEVNIPHEKSRLFVWHFTTLYYNGEGQQTRSPRGKMDVKQFIKSMDGVDGLRPHHTNRNDGCCAVNWVIDRDGIAHQLAPLNDKLAHAIGVNGFSTGVELEASYQSTVTTKQYESAAYLALAVTQVQNLLGHQPLDQIVQGHGELSDRLFGKYSNRNDFDAPVASLLRSKLAVFLQQNPLLELINNPLQIKAH